MYRYTEKIGDLTRTYEAESPEKVVELVLSVTMDIQPLIDKRHLDQQHRQQRTGIFLDVVADQIDKDHLVQQLTDKIKRLAVDPQAYDIIS
jgi:hypothetical protein